VIIGALFKIMHWPYATYILSTGMLVEAFIFFLSAFEEQPEHYEWTNVFPELNKDYVGDKVSMSFASMGGGNGSMSLDIVDDETKNKIKEGLKKLASSVENVKDISDSAVASGNYRDAMNSAAEAMNKVSENSTNISSNIEGFNNAIEASSQGFEKISTSVNTYSNFVDTFQENFKSSSDAFTGNISTLNAIYEIQIKNTNEYLATFDNVHQNVKDIVSHVSGTVESSKLYREESEKLGRNISNLNDVYGSMLSVFNNQKNK
jgi:gliding motility-associated protein GldL